MTPEAMEGLRRFYEAWMKAVSASWENTLRNPAFVAAMGQGMSEAMDLRAVQEAAVEKVLKGMHFPTRTEFGGLKRQIADLETKVEQMRLERSRPPRKARQKRTVSR